MRVTNRMLADRLRAMGLDAGTFTAADAEYAYERLREEAGNEAPVAGQRGQRAGVRRHLSEERFARIAEEMIR